MLRSIQAQGLVNRLRHGSNTLVRSPFARPARAPTSFTRPLASNPPLRQEAHVEIQGGDILPFEGLDEQLGRSDGPIIRYEPTGAPSEEQRQALKHALGLDVLGTPAEVLICEPNRKSSKKQTVRLDSRAQEEASHNAGPDESEILDQIERERGIIDPDDARLNIEELKISWARENLLKDDYISDASYDDLLSKLRNGFNKVQLLHYLDFAEKNLGIGVHDLRRAYTSDAFSRSAWQAGTTPIEQRLTKAISEDDQPNSKIGHFSHYDKTFLAEAIISDCWSLRRVSREDEVGELELRLLPRHFKLLLNHQRELLKKTSEKYGVKLEVYKPRNIIRITARQDVCGDIFRLFKFMIDSIQQQAFEMPLNSAEIDEKSKGILIKQIEAMTNTVILLKQQKATSDGRKVFACDILYLGPETKDVDDAQRILTGRLQIRSNRDDRLLLPSGLHNASPSLVDVGSSLPLQDRDNLWCRFTTTWQDPAKGTLETSYDSTADKSPATSNKARPKISENVTGFLNRKGYPMQSHSLTDSAYWKPDVTLFSAVHFGQVVFPESAVSEVTSNRDSDIRLQQTIDELAAKIASTKNALKKDEDADQKISDDATNDLDHSHTPSQSTKFMQKAVDQSLLNILVRTHGLRKNELAALQKSSDRMVHAAQRKFVPAVPGFTSLLSRLGQAAGVRDQKSVESSESMVITLLPTLPDGQSPKLLEAIPILQIHIALSKNTDPEIAHVRLSPGQVNFDTPMPDHSMDLRVSQLRSFRSKSGSIDPAITTFIKRSKLNIFGTESLTTPNSLRLQIPTFTLQQSKRADETPLSQDHAAGEDLNVMYVFSTFEIKSTLRIPYAHNTILAYNNIEAGRLGGRREEFSLQLPPPGRFSPSQKMSEARTLPAAQREIIVKQIALEQKMESRRLGLAAERLVAEAEGKVVPKWEAGVESGEGNVRETEADEGRRRRTTSTRRMKDGSTGRFGARRTETSSERKGGRR